MVSAHGEWISRRTENAGVCDGHECKQGGTSHQDLPNPTSDGKSRICDWREAWLRERRRFIDPNHHHQPEHVDGHRGSKRQENSPREIAFRVLDLLGNARNLRHTDVRDKDEPRGRENRTEAFGKERFESSGIDARHALREKPSENRQQPDHHDHLEPSGCFGTEEVDAAEQRRQSSGDPDNPVLSEVDVERDIRTHADQRECGLEGEGEPGAEPSDCAPERAQTPIEEKVRPARLGHGRRELNDAESRGDHDRGGDQVTQNDCWACLLVGKTRQKEETRTERGSDRDGEDAEEIQFFLEFRRGARRVLGFRHRLGFRWLLNQ